MRRRVTRRLTRLQTMRNVLKYSKIVQNGSVRLRFGCGYFFQFTYVQYCKRVYIRGQVHVLEIKKTRWL